MKTLLFVLMASVSFQVMSQTPVVVEAPVDHVFVPRGFDDNDNVEVVVTGSFPNPCFTRNKVSVRVIEQMVKVTVTSLSRDDEQSPLCESLKVPFTEVVTIGNLSQGHYQVVINEGGEYEIMSQLNVAPSASERVDDHLYAKVDYVELGFTGGLSGDAVLMTQSLSPCLELDRVEYLSNGKDTLSVLPIMKKNSQECREHRSRLVIPIKFDLERFSHKRLLIFVRSIEGKSVQSLIDKNQ